MWEKLQHFDRRWIFLSVAISIVLPLIYPLNLPMRVSPMTKAIYDNVEKLPAGSKVLISMDYDPGTKPELDPFARAITRHFLNRGVKIVYVSMWPNAVPLVQAIMKETIELEYPETEYGRDYAYMGYMAGGDLLIKHMGENFRTAFSKDNRGTPIDKLPVLNGVANLKSFDMVVDVSAGNPGLNTYVQQVQSRYNLLMAGAVTTVATFDNIAYYQSGQLCGLSSGGKGSADYEKLIHKPGPATQLLDVQNAGHALIILFVVFGNVIYFKTRKKVSL